jgi:hypothetical protein
MKKTKLIRVRNRETSLQVTSDQSSSDINGAEVEESINEESVKVKPTRIGVDGFSSWVRKLRPTRDGMVSEVEKPLLIATSGHRIKEGEIKGQCVCGGFDNFLYNCEISGCKRPLCLKHVYFFELGEKKIPYCLEHYRQAMDEFDTWQVHEKERK